MKKKTTPQSKRQPIRVLLVDDHAVVRSGLSAFLMAFREFELVGEAENGFDAVHLSEERHPDVVLMDLQMPEMDGASATQLIRARCPQTQVVALTSFREEELVQRVLQAGAIGYLLKNVGAEELAAAIRRAHVGQPTLAPEATSALIHATTRPPAPGHDLSSREREVLALMVKGRSNREIARRLVISPSTVKFHIGSILRKLGVKRRTEAVALAVEHHIA